MGSEGIIGETDPEGSPEGKLPGPGRRHRSTQCKPRQGTSGEPPSRQAIRPLSPVWETGIPPYGIINPSGMGSESSTGGTGLVRGRLESPGRTVETMPVVVRGWSLHSTQEPVGIIQARMAWLEVTRMMADIIGC